MQTITYNLNQNLNGGKITSFNYSRSLNEIGGTWDAEVAGGNFLAGSNITISGVLTGGVISNAYKDNQGLWHIEGYDAGIKLMRTTPAASLLPTGNARSVISYLAKFCRITLQMSENGLSGFNVRSAVTGTTCAEAILELAMLSGLIAYINNDGKLCVTTPSSVPPSFSTIIDDSGSSIDLDGYATQVTVVINRRKESKENTNSGKTKYSGRTPASSPHEENTSGSFNFTDSEGISVSGSYDITKLEPFGVVKSATHTVTRDGITVTNEEEHDYRYHSKKIWRGDQEYVLFAFCEEGYTHTKIIEGDYRRADSSTTHLKEITTEKLERDFSMGNMPWFPSDWTNQLWYVSKETKTRSTVREGGETPLSNMPSYSPPFDSKITREFSRHELGNSVVCVETEISYESRQVGNIAPVIQDGIPKIFQQSNSYLAIPTHSTPEWVKIEKYKTYYERYDNDGACEVSAQSEFNDNGSKWLVQNLPEKKANATELEQKIAQYQEDYSKFSQISSGLQVSTNGGGIAQDNWKFIELAGRTRTYKENENNNPSSATMADWYNNGTYVQSKTCPHLESSDKKCSIYGISAVGDFDGDACPYKKFGWRNCVRAIAALEQARREYDTPLLDTPVISVKSKGASSTTPAAGYQREIYVDDIISESDAQKIADNIANNILKVKGTKGIRKSVVIPYDPSLMPNGNIISVEHNWANLQTTINYLTSGTIPNFMIPSSVAGIASIISDRDAGRRTKPMSGTVTTINDDKSVIVQIGGMSYTCDTKLVNLGTGDAVLVSFTSGNSLRGQIIERL